MPLWLLGGNKMIVRIINRTTNELIEIKKTLTINIINNEIIIIDIRYNQYIYPLNDWMVTVI